MQVSTGHRAHWLKKIDSQQIRYLESGQFQKAQELTEDWVKLKELRAETIEEIQAPWVRRRLPGVITLASSVVTVAACAAVGVEHLIGLAAVGALVSLPMFAVPEHNADWLSAACGAGISVAGIALAATGQAAFMFGGLIGGAGLSVLAGRALFGARPPDTELLRQSYRDIIDRWNLNSKIAKFDDPTHSQTLALLGQFQESDERDKAQLAVMPGQTLLDKYRNSYLHGNLKDTTLLERWAPRLIGGHDVLGLSGPSVEVDIETTEDHIEVGGFLVPNYN